MGSPSFLAKSVVRAPHSTLTFLLHWFSFNSCHGLLPKGKGLLIVAGMVKVVQLTCLLWIYPGHGATLLRGSNTWNTTEKLLERLSHLQTKKQHQRFFFCLYFYLFSNSSSIHLWFQIICGHFWWRNHWSSFSLKLFLHATIEKESYMCIFLSFYGCNKTIRGKKKNCLAYFLM